jgi:hypothetical protein
MAVLALAAVCGGALIVGPRHNGDVRVLAHIVAGAVMFGVVRRRGATAGVLCGAYTQQVTRDVARVGSLRVGTVVHSAPPHMSAACVRLAVG